MVASLEGSPVFLSRTALVRVAGRLVRFAAALPDSRALLVASDDRALPVAQLCPFDSPLAAAADRSARAYWRPEATEGQGAAATPRPYTTGWTPWPGRFPGERSPEAIAFGFGDRFSLLLRARPVPRPAEIGGDGEGAGERTYETALTFKATAIARFLQTLQAALADCEADRRLLDRALDRWPAQPNQPDLQSDLTLQLLAAFDGDRRQQSLERQEAARIVTRKIAQRIARGRATLRPSPAIARDASTGSDFPGSGERATPDDPRDRPWLEQGRLLQALLDASHPQFGPEGVLRRSAEALVSLFDVGRCQIAFYDPQSRRPRWSATARAPNLLARHGRSGYPPWAALERARQQHPDASSWISDEPLAATEGDDRQPANAPATLAAWLQADPQRGTDWVGGLAILERWAGDRPWESADMYLLHAAVQQVEQALTQALFYRQADRQRRQTALLARLARDGAAPDLSALSAELADLTEADGCWIWICEDGRWRAIAAAPGRPAPESPHRLDAGDPPLPALQQNRAIALDGSDRAFGATATPLLPEGTADGWLAPLRTGNRLWGAVALFRGDRRADPELTEPPDSRSWTTEARSLLEAVADSLARVLQGAERGDRPDGEARAAAPPAIGTDEATLARHRRRLDRQTEALQATLRLVRDARQAERDWLARIGPEFRMPLTAIIGMSASLQQTPIGPLNDRQKQYLQIVHDSGKQVMALVDRLLAADGSRAATLEAQPFDPKTTLEPVLAAALAEAGDRQIPLTATWDEPPASEFYGDPQALRVLVAALLFRGLRAAPPGGSVRARLRCNAAGASLVVDCQAGDSQQDRADGAGDWRDAATIAAGSAATDDATVPDGNPAALARAEATEAADGAIALDLPAAIAQPDAIAQPNAIGEDARIAAAIDFAIEPDAEHDTKPDGTHDTEPDTEQDTEPDADIEADIDLALARQILSASGGTLQRDPTFAGDRWIAYLPSPRSLDPPATAADKAPESPAAPSEVE